MTINPIVRAVAVGVIVWVLEAFALALILEPGERPNNLVLGLGVWIVPIAAGYLTYRSYTRPRT